MLCSTTCVSVRCVTFICTINNEYNTTQTTQSSIHPVCAADQPLVISHSVLHKLPLLIIERAGGACAQPSCDTMKVIRVRAGAPCNTALFRLSGLGLARDARYHQLVVATGPADTTQNKEIRESQWRDRWTRHTQQASCQAVYSGMCLLSVSDMAHVSFSISAQHAPHQQRYSLEQMEKGRLAVCSFGISDMLPSLSLCVGCVSDRRTRMRLPATSSLALACPSPHRRPLCLHLRHRPPCAQSPACLQPSSHRRSHRDLPS